MDKNISSIMDLLNVIKSMREELEGKIEFDSRGWPIFKKEFFLEEWPELVITHRNRKNSLVKDKRRTLLCFYEGDKYIYPRFNRLNDEISEYREYLGVVAADITVTNDMDRELQALIMLANQLFMAILAVKGIKIVMNTRNGITETCEYFKNIPKGVMCASGFLGCDTSSGYWDTVPYINKILCLSPRKLIIYGKKDREVQEQLDILGIEYRRFNDFHTESKRGISIDVRL